MKCYTERVILYSCNSREEKVIKKVHRWLGPRVSLSQFLFLLFSNQRGIRKFSQAEKENLHFSTVRRE